jgi:hypothetical protein
MKAPRLPALVAVSIVILGLLLQAIAMCGATRWKYSEIKKIAKCY